MVDDEVFKLLASCWSVGCVDSLCLQCPSSTLYADGYRLLQPLSSAPW
jgi:hypothetical protein